jgi:toxin ParE1/3/4
MRYEVQITRRADVDIAEIAAFIAQDNPGRAVSFVTELYNEANALCEFPYRGKQMRGRPTARRLIYGNYLIVYAIHEAEKKIAVLRFLHSARVA